MDSRNCLPCSWPLTGTGLSPAQCCATVHLGDECRSIMSTLVKERGLWIFNMQSGPLTLSCRRWRGWVLSCISPQPRVSTWHLPAGALSRGEASAERGHTFAVKVGNISDCLVRKCDLAECDDDRGYLRHPAGGWLRDAPLLGVAAAGPWWLQDALGLLDQALLVRGGDPWTWGDGQCVLHQWFLKAWDVFIRFCLTPKRFN